MISWGINALNHDASISVFDGKECVFASHSERFSKIKNDSELNHSIIEHALQYGVPDEILWAEKPYLKKFRQLISGDRRFFSLTPKQHLNKFNINKPITYINHHRCHASAAAYTSGYSESLVFIFDAIGEFDTISVWLHQHDKLKCIHKQSYFNSLGLFYSAFAKLIGLKPNEEEFILMGMAGYGKPLYKEQMLEKYLTIDYPYIHLKSNLHKGVNFKYTNKFDVAASVQAIFEEVTLGICNFFKNKYNINNACFAGGCSLNCTANTKYFDIFDNVWVFPNAGDAGNSYGAVLSTLNQQIEYNPYLGYNIKHDIDVNQIVEALKAGKIVGIANGKAEFGPRALGNRSLLADPRIKNIQDLMNDVKHRERFRPFAPAILQEYASSFFDLKTQESKYMNFAYKNKFANTFPGTVHVDGTSRVQTVDHNTDSTLYNILVEWHRETNSPVLLNTSLNIKGQPIVNDEHDKQIFSTKYSIDVF